MTAASVLATALGGRKNGVGWRACCPAHDDKSPSLDITEKNGMVLFVCRAGCSQDAVLDALRGRGLWDTKPQANGHDHSHDTNATPPDKHPELGTPDHRYEYTTATGRTLGYVYRWEAKPGRRKEFRPLWRIDGRWQWKGPPDPRPLYGLADLAAHPDKPVLIVEGEKTAEGAKDHVDGYVVMTWPSGSGSVGHLDLAPLAGRDIVLWPDNDEGGRKAMRALADRLVSAKRVRGVKLPEGLPEKWDLGDAIPANLDPIALCGRAIDVRLDRLSSLKLVDAAALLAADFKPPRWAIPDLVPEGLTILAGKPKTGKSWAALDFVVAVGSGGKALGNLQCEAGPALYLALEDTQRRLQGRLRAVLQGAPFPSGRLAISVTWKKADEGGLEDIRAWLTAHPDGRLVVVDTLAKMRGRPDRDKGVYDNDYSSVGAFKALADEFAVPIVLIHHLNKGTTDDPVMAVSGTAGLTGSADTILVLKRQPGETFGTLYVRGRDVVETEIGIQFDNDTGKWLHVGSVADHVRSEQRKEIIDLLRENVDGMTPIQIADELGRKRGAIRALLMKMRRAGDVSQLPSGKYYVARMGN